MRYLNYAYFGLPSNLLALAVRPAFGQFVAGDESRRSSLRQDAARVARRRTLGRVATRLEAATLFAEAQLELFE